jgi:hypothetical protein
MDDALRIWPRPVHGIVDHPASSYGRLAAGESLAATVDR